MDRVQTAKTLPAARSLLRPAVQASLSLLGLVILLGLWLGFSYWLGRSVPLAEVLGPGEAFRSLYALLAQNELTAHSLTSLKRVLLSLLAALAIGVPVGVAVGRSCLLDRITGSAFQFLRMVSPLSWMPIAVMAFGIGDAPIYFLLTITAVWPVILSTAAGVRQLNPGWLLLARSLSATRLELLRRVVVPGILGHILTGTRVAIGMIWIALIPCEMLGVSSGLGYFILDTRDRLAYSELMAAIVLIGGLGFLLDASAQRLYRHWSPAIRG